MITVTLAEAIRNEVAFRPGIKPQAIISRLAKITFAGKPWTAREIPAAIGAEEQAGRISRTPDGGYHIGPPRPAPAADLELVSTDPHFAQPSLF